jgi:hypothetical protein
MFFLFFLSAVEIFTVVRVGIYSGLINPMINIRGNHLFFNILFNSLPKINPAAEQRA